LFISLFELLLFLFFFVEKVLIWFNLGQGKKYVCLRKIGQVGGQECFFFFFNFTGQESDLKIACPKLGIKTL
jgi:hypothetical protein